MTLNLVLLILLFLVLVYLYTQLRKLEKQLLVTARAVAAILLDKAPSDPDLRPEAQKEVERHERAFHSRSNR